MIIGAPNAGKTAFTVQLIKRLDTQSGKLRLETSPEDLKLITDALDAMNEGRAPAHTELSKYGQLELELSVRSTGETFRIPWPDYGGEQIDEIIDRRVLSPGWQQRAAESTAWLLFLRLKEYRDEDTLLTRPIGELFAMQWSQANDEMIDSEELDTNRMPPQVRVIELLQALLYARFVGSPAAALPRLFIVLSCWDELDPEDLERPPAALLAEYMPMLSSFTLARWGGAHAVYGLSATERALQKDLIDPEYATRGPEFFGYLVGRDGKTSRDLTELVADAIRS